MFDTGNQLIETKMSLEEKFASLSIDDATSVVDTVKSEGVEKSGLAANISVLAARCGSKDEDEAVSALKTVKALAEGIPEAQVFTKECLGACKCKLCFSFFFSTREYVVWRNLECIGHKPKLVEIHYFHAYTRRDGS